MSKKQADFLAALFATLQHTFLVSNDVEKLIIYEDNLYAFLEEEYDRRLVPATLKVVALNVLKKPECLILPIEFLEQTPDDKIRYLYSIVYTTDGLKRTESFIASSMGYQFTTFYYYPDILE